MMSTRLLTTAAFCFCISAFSRPLPVEVLRLVPTKHDLDSPKMKKQRQELERLVTTCGSGAIEGVLERDPGAVNRCSYRVRLDDLFFEKEWNKTGLLRDRDWAYQDGVTWYEPVTRAPVPDNFDLRDLMKNGQPDLRKQNCGDCWAWATHHGLELSRAVHEQKVFDHSIQTVLSCSNEGSCGGGYMSAVDFLRHGLPMEPEFSYAGSNKKCKFSSTEISTGWQGKIISAPYIGSSRDFSRARRLKNGSYREGSKVQKMMEAMYQWKSPLVVTVSAYNVSGAGVYDSCSAVNSGGNHMVAIVGWEKWNGKRVAHVWNSWGHSHGDKGVSRIVWECGDGKLNRGLGVSAKIVQYRAPCTPPNAAQIGMHEMLSGQTITIGAEQTADVTCSWMPRAGLANPDSCVTQATPGQTTEYHLAAENACGKSSSMTLVQVWPARGEALDPTILTPFGEITSR